MKSLDNDADTFSAISRKNKYNNQLIEKASLEIKERRMRESGIIGPGSSKRAFSHVSSHNVGTHSEGNLEKLQSAFLLGGRDRGGGDETSNNVKSVDEDPAKMSEKKASSIAPSRAAQSYLSNRLSKQRGGGRPTKNGEPDRVSLASIQPSNAASRALKS